MGIIKNFFKGMICTGLFILIMNIALGWYVIYKGAEYLIKEVPKITRTLFPNVPDTAPSPEDITWVDDGDDC